MEAEVSFGSWLRRRRRALDLTQQELADCAGCSLVTIRKFESDERRPSKLLAELLAGCLDIPAGERERFVRFARRADTEAPEPPPVVAEPQAPLPQRALLAAPVLGNLPSPLTDLIGREADIAEVAARLSEPGTRLLTLTGPGGAGKTRLAIAAARALALERPELVTSGVYFVDLSSVGEPEGVLFAAARALNVSEKAAPTIDEAIRATIRGWRALVVFDNFEHVIDAAAHLPHILAAADGLKLLVTSRRLLQLYGEHELPVRPLAVPAIADPDPAEVAASPAVALFVARSRAANATFQLDSGNLPAVVEITRRLEGLPLAIELAAARSRRFEPPELLAQLQSSLDLGGHLRHAHDRQLTMRQAMDWSYRLLDEDEQRFFRALGVFGGAFEVADAAAIFAISESEARRWLFDLAGQSMIRYGRVSGGQPFRLLFVLREFALEQLEAAGELAWARGRHFEYFNGLVQTATVAATAGEFAPARELLPPVADDLRAALDWSLAGPTEAERGLNLAVNLTRTDYWIENSLLAEGSARLAQGLATGAGSPALRAAALVSAGRIAYYRDHLQAAVSYGEEALDILEALGPEADEEWLLVARRVVANAAGSLGDTDRLFAYQQQNIAIYRRRGDLIGEANALQSIGITATFHGDYGPAIASLTQAVVLLRRHGDRGDLLLALNALGLAYLVAGQYAEAEPALAEALALATELDVRMWQAMTTGNLGHLLIPLGRFDEARDYFRQAGRLAREAGSPQYGFQSGLGLATIGLLADEPLDEVWLHLAECLQFYEDEGRLPSRFERLSDVLALYWARAGRAELAARLIARGETIRDEARLPRYANVQPVYERARAIIDGQLDPAAQAAATARGRVDRNDDLVTEMLAAAP